MMEENKEQMQAWAGFRAANRFRRAVRGFDATPIPESDVAGMLEEATLAPSSGNTQPYKFHWVKEPSLKDRVAQACNGQKAARSAPELIVIEAGPAIGMNTASAQLAYVEAPGAFDAKSKAYHRAQIAKFRKIIGLGSSALWSPIVFIAALICPTLSLLPIGHIGGRHWAARNSAFAAQTLMLAAAAKGIDSCPMEGFSAPKIAKILGLPRGSVIPLVIALGYRADGARIEERWRRPVDDVVVRH